MNELSEKLAFNREINRHLHELGLLVGRPVHKKELLSLAETKGIRVKANQIVRQPIRKFEIPFIKKREQKFISYIEKLIEVNSSSVYLWTPASNICGVMRPVPLKTFCISFPFDLNPEGIVVILTSDLRDQLLLDYSQGDFNEEMLEVETRGEQWGCINY